MMNRSEEVVFPSVIQYEDAKVANSMASGKMNINEAQVLANIRYSIRQGHQQWKPGPPRPERICLVGSGPSLEQSLPELLQMVWEGAILVTINGAYHWCIDHGLRPQTQIVMDGRPSNARFVIPAVPKCNYVIASQCAPEVWNALAYRDHVWIFHAVVHEEGLASELLDQYYRHQWLAIGGGTTTVTRAINLLRIAGYLRFDLFGIDCCWQGNVHHAMPQPENANDKSALVHAGVADRPETMRAFVVSPWQLKQVEDLLTIMKVNGRHFVLTSHGDGMFTHLLSVLGDDLLTIEKE